MKKERDITIKVIENKNISYNRLANYFARKYNEKYNKQIKESQNIKA